VQQDAARGLGVSPNSLSLAPKSGGSRGLNREDYKSLLWDPLLDSRLRGNDSRGCEGFVPAEGLGVSPKPPISPHEWGTKGVDSAS